MRYNIKALHQHDNGDYWVRINNKELPYVDEDIVLAIKEKDKEIERLNNIINELEKYLDNLHWFRLGKKDESGNMEYFYASVSNFYKDTKSILKGEDKE